METRSAALKIEEEIRNYSDNLNSGNKIKYQRYDVLKSRLGFVYFIALAVSLILLLAK